MSGQAGSDERAIELRDSITAIDRQLVVLVNQRLELVREMRDHKRANGYPLVAPGREEWLLAHLCETNEGALSDAGVRALAERVIELGKVEVYGLAPADDD